MDREPYCALVVDDEPTILSLIELVLKHQGYRVIAAGGAEEALAKYESLDSPLDLLLTDVAMPGMPGPTLAAELRARQPGLPVLFMSGCSSRADLDAILPGHQFETISKPFTNERLLAQVELCLADSREHSLSA